MKSGRHEKILSIISEYSIETQDELLKKLKEAGARKNSRQRRKIPLRRSI